MARSAAACTGSGADGARVFITDTFAFQPRTRRSAIRNQLERHADVVKRSTSRKNLDLGLRNYSREDLEVARRAGEMLQINVLGLASIAQDVTPELARAAIASVYVLGALHASPAVKAALADRMR